MNKIGGNIMKLRKLSFVMPLLGLFTSCSNDTPEEPTWNKVDADLMKEHLFGEVLPYLDKENLIVKYDSEFQELTITGGVIENDDLAKYASKYVVKDGWEGGDISAANKLEEDTVFEFEKMIATTEGKRFVNVRFYALDAEEHYSKTGSFFLSAVSPYEYEYPEETIKSFVKAYFDSDISIPKKEGDYYEFSYQYACLSIYYESNEPDGGYSSLLTTNNWTVKDELVDDYYFATSPDKKYVVRYLYLPKYGALDIYFDTAKEFPSDVINAFFTKYSVSGVTIPTYEGALGGFTFIEDSKNQQYIDAGYPENIHGTLFCYSASEESYNNYLDKLEGLNWEINRKTQYASATFMLSDSIYTMELAYRENDNATEITIYGYLEPKGTPSWPDISDYLGPNVTDTIPMFEGDYIGFNILDDAWGTAIYVQVTKGTETSCVEQYKATLLKNKYTFAYKDALGDSYYYSPNHQICVGVYYATAGSITIPFEVIA